MISVTIYTDGSCIDNPGPGGYAAVLLAGGSHRKEVTGYENHSTNNRCELLAAIHGLKALKHRCRVQIRSDSRYLVDGGNGLTKAKVNGDLWEQLRSECAKHDVLFVWLKGHRGHPENERCDELAKEAAWDAEMEGEPAADAT